MTGNKHNINNAVLYELAQKIHDMSKEERFEGTLKNCFFAQSAALCSKFNPRNIKDMPVVKFFTCLELERKF